MFFEATRLTGRETFENVSLSYIPGQVILKNIGIGVRSGEKIATADLTGSGKSALAGLTPAFTHLGYIPAVFGGSYQ
jgi:ATP-binding cassette subfamily B protein